MNVYVQWQLAVDLGKTYNLKDTESQLTRFATFLLESGKKGQAIELWRRANYRDKSAELLFEMAETAKKANAPPLKLKKLYVLAAHEAEKHLQNVKSKSDGNTLNALLTNLPVSSPFSKMLDSPWRCAEAYHFYCLAQFQFYAKNASSAVRTVNPKITWTGSSFKEF